MAENREKVEKLSSTKNSQKCLEKQGVFDESATVTRKKSWELKVRCSTS
jgi:hypothetical protein